MMIEDNVNGCVIQYRAHSLVDQSDINFFPFRYICKNEAYDKGSKNSWKNKNNLSYFYLKSG